MKILGVITGDIVNSREMLPKERNELYKAFKKFLVQVNKEKTIQDFEVLARF